MMDWIEARLGDLVTGIKGGGTPSRKNESYWGGDIPWVSVKDFDGIQLDGAQEHITEKALENSSTRIIPAGNVILVTRVGLGKVAVNEVDVAINQDLKGLFCKPAILPEYLVYYLYSRSNRIESQGSGATVKGITLDQVRSWQIPLPPPSEQRRIVALLDRADALREKRAQADNLAKRILPALFYDMFGDPATNPMEWDKIKLGDLIADGPRNGLYKPKSEYGSGTRILRIDGFYAGRIVDQNALKRVQATEEEAEKYALSEDDIVVNRVNSEEYLGKCALVPPLSEPTIFESNMMRFSVDTDRVDPVYLVEHLKSNAIKTEILKKSKRAINQASINQQDVKSFSIALPPLDLQRKFAKRAQSIERLIKRQNSAGGQSERLFDVLLHRAFTGDLTAEWRVEREEELRIEQEEQLKALGVEEQTELFASPSA